MRTVTIGIPEEIIKIYNDVETLRQIIIEEFVASEYKKGTISIRQGAKIMGLTYQAFMIDFLGKKRMSVINGTPEELDFESRQEDKWLDEILKNKEQDDSHI